MFAFLGWIGTENARIIRQIGEELNYFKYVGGLQMMPKLAIIADDLTGANDSGVQFAKYGMRVQVFLAEPSTEQGQGPVDVLVLDTDSRAISAKVAYERVRSASRMVGKFASASSRPLIFKKIDSTLRGNLGQEIDAAMHEFNFPWAAVVPAFPANGRITAGGWHLLHQVPIAQSEIARDPKAPVQMSVVPELLASQSTQQVGHVGLSDVVGGSGQIRARVDELLMQGNKLISFDATTGEHMAAIAAAIARNGGTDVLWVGCAGLAETIPAAMNWPIRPFDAKTEPTAGPALIVAGSVSNVTHKQIQKLLEQPNVRPISLQADRLVSGDSQEKERCIEAAAALLREGYDVLLSSAMEADAVARARSAGSDQGIDNHQVSERVAVSIGKIVRGLMDCQPAGLFLTGGDTAVAVCRELGVHAIEVLSEVSMGIPLGKLVGGIRPGLRVVTKAGAFGNEMAMVDSIKVLKGR